MKDPASKDPASKDSASSRDPAAPSPAGLLASLDELLEAERAGARVTLESIDQTRDPGLRALLTRIHHDEVRWCGMLIDAIRRQGAVPSSRTGAFYEKAMAVTDPTERLALLNRGQRWVARRLQGLLADLDDAGLRAHLEAMLTCHDDNVGRVDAHLGGMPGRG